VSDEVVRFLSEQIQKLDQATYEMKTDEEREIFRRQLFQLPNLRLRSLIKNDGTLPTGVNQQLSVFHLQFFVMGINLLFPTAEEFHKKHPDMDTSVYPLLRSAFPNGAVFMAYTDASTTYQDLPFSFFQINYDELKVNDPTIAVQPYSTEINELLEKGLIKEDDRFVDRLLTVKPYLHFNYPQLAMSVLLALKQRMPK
jgi:hypothetical protein